jgi:hypothetical protein
MPENATITSADWFTFIAKARAKASQMMTNLKMWRGHILPFDPNTVASANNTYDIGASDAQFNNVYTKNFQKVNGTDIGGLLPLGPHGLGLFQNTTTTVTIKKHDGTDLSTTNYGIVMARQIGWSTASLVPVTISANVVLTTAGLNFGMNGLGDMSNAVLDVSYVNQPGTTTMHWGISWYPGCTRESIEASLTSAIQASVNDRDMMLVNSAINTISALTPCFWFRANYNDSGGAANFEWTVTRTSLGHSGGVMRPFLTSYTGFSSSPTGSLLRWTAIGTTVHVVHMMTAYAPGTSNATTFYVNLPAKHEAQTSTAMIGGLCVDNSAQQSLPCYVTFTTASYLSRISRRINSGPWTGSGSKSADFNIFYRIYDPQFT